MEGQFYGWGTIIDGWRKGPWTPQEDQLLMEHVKLHGEGKWNSVSRLTGLKRSGKSSRLRWVNYLRPDLKRGKITAHEETVILQLHARWGNRWSMIARSLPGRTDNEIKNYWRTHFKKKPMKDGEKKAEARYARLQQQQQQTQQQQQQQQQEAREAMMAQELQEMACTCGNIMPLMLQEGGLVGESTSGCSEEEDRSSEDETCYVDTWGQLLWNLDDVADQALAFY